MWIMAIEFRGELNPTKLGTQPLGLQMASGSAEAFPDQPIFPRLLME